MKVSDFKFIKGYGYPKIDKLVMQYHTSRDLKAMLIAAKKHCIHPSAVRRVHHRFNKLRYAEEIMELFGE